MPYLFIKYIEEPTRIWAAAIVNSPNVYIKAWSPVAMATTSYLAALHMSGLVPKS